MLLSPNAQSPNAQSRYAPAVHTGIAQQRAALRDYRAIDVEARVASASPHLLVLMLFDRLSLHLRDARSASLAGDKPRRLKATEMALALVDGLDATLDDARGGDVAQSLHSVYALVRDRLLDGATADLGEAQSAIETLADAWRQIAPARPGQTRL